MFMESLQTVKMPGKVGAVYAAPLGYVLAEERDCTEGWLQETKVQRVRVCRKGDSDGRFLWVWCKDGAHLDVEKLSEESVLEPKFRKAVFCSSEKMGTNVFEFIIVNIFDAKTKEHLMTAFMNLEAWDKTKSTMIVHFWSTSRNELWRKGATSGNEMEVVEAFLDCDGDAVDVYVHVKGDGVACHTGQRSCFHNKVL